MLGLSVMLVGRIFIPVIGVGTYTLIDDEMLLFSVVALMVTLPGARDVSRPLASTFTTAELDDHQNTRWFVAFRGVTLAFNCRVVPKKRFVLAGFCILSLIEIDTPDTWIAGRTDTLNVANTVEPSVLDTVIIGRAADEGTAVIPVTVAVNTKQGFSV